MVAESHDAAAGNQVAVDTCGPSSVPTIGTIVGIGTDAPYGGGSDFATFVAGPHVAFAQPPYMGNVSFGQHADRHKNRQKYAILPVLDATF